MPTNPPHKHTETPRKTFQFQSQSGAGHDSIQRQAKTDDIAYQSRRRISFAKVSRSYHLTFTYSSLHTTARHSVTPHPSPSRKRRPMVLQDRNVGTETTSGLLQPL